MAENPERILEQARLALSEDRLITAERKALFRELHGLAEQQYAPAQAFFQTLLRHPDADWRLEAIRNLGHFGLLDEGVLEQLRHMLVNDPDYWIRIVAASTLGARLGAAEEWPDRSLEQALQEDPVLQVRITAFKSLLITGGVPYARMEASVAEADAGRVQPSVELAQKIIASKTE